MFPWKVPTRPTFTGTRTFPIPGPVWFDTHCHLQDPRHEGRVPEVVERALAAGVTRMVCCATREEDWASVRGLARQYGAVLPMVGLHPWRVETARPGWLERLKALLGEGRVGLGECGLDFSPGKPSRLAQEAAFIAQLRLAEEGGAPISIHCVGAWGRLLEILRSHPRAASQAVIHAYSGSKEMAGSLQELGLHFAFSSAILRPGARRCREALAQVAQERLLLETDSPFGAGTQGEPSDLPEVAMAAAQIRGLALEALAESALDRSHFVFRRLLG